MTSAVASSAGVGNSPALDTLERLVEEIGTLQSKLILLVGNGSKTRLLHALAQRLNAAPFNLGVKLGHRLAATPVSERGFSATELLRDITGSVHGDAPLLLDNLEVLFEPSLKINPLDLIKRLAHARRVVAVWPGEVRDDRLVYAGMGHPEHRDYTRDGIVVFETAQGQQGTRT
ncbi:TPA: BREX-3 system P-loop-containing protein BrxF [Stenotrophomonas maltophilia]|nr:BREX-3 system P-loop-containing protein BrxF [Stenotrophomonas maltophilia]